MNGNKIWGFSNVYNDDQSPYDFYARIGYAILSELISEEAESLDIQKGQYTLVSK